ncbi:MAG: hypothetical protein HZA34_03865 [Candidatus Pacebacteria bacterium]|nr:hypothetical protein [Candidatus Paceibacterota bacterium]
MKSIGSVLQKYTLDDKGGHITREFQDYGYRLAVELNDLDHTSLYIRMAKTVDRGILEQARTFVLDANARNRARLFMWKVGELKRSKNGVGEKKRGGGTVRSQADKGGR